MNGYFVAVVVLNRSNVFVNFCTENVFTEAKSLHKSMLFDKRLQMMNSAH